MLRKSAGAARLETVWRRLPARDRALLSLLFYEGLTPTEAAHALGLPVREVERAVKSRLAGFRRALVIRLATRVLPRAKAA